MYNDYILDYVTKLMSSEKAQLLDEKLIMFNQGKNYGQVVFMAGGAGSGKGFAQSKFMEKNKFKVRDVDEWKKAFMKLSKDPRFSNYHAVVKRNEKGRVLGVDVLKDKPKLDYTDTKFMDVILLGDLDLKNPDHVFILHLSVKKLGIKNKTLDLNLSDLKKGTLPNILFDVTLKDMDDITDVLPTLKEVGYDAKGCLLYTSPSPRDRQKSRMPSSA